MFFLVFRRETVDLAEQNDFLFAARVSLADDVLSVLPPLAPVKRGSLRLDQVGVGIVSLNCFSLIFELTSGVM